VKSTITVIKRDEDPLGWAKGVLEYIAAQKVRWGKMWSVNTDRLYHADDIAEAAGIVMQELVKKSDITQEEHTLVKRQLTASKAREAKMKKAIGKLKAKVSILAAVPRSEPYVKVDKT